MPALQMELWTDEEIEIFKQFNFKCVRCLKLAVTLHEIRPKSLAPKTWMKPENRIPICAKCHSWAHDRGTSYSAPILAELRNKRLNAKS